MPDATPSQTIGPFFAIMQPLGSAELVPPDHPDAITVTGTVFDGAGAPVVDALVELWQPDGAGAYPQRDPGGPAASGFSGWGRCATDSMGAFRFVTVKPGPVAAPESRWQAPHLTLSIFARGLLNHLVTRLYFPDEADANAGDPLLRSIADPAIRATLVAQDAGPGELRFDIHLRGEQETAFLVIDDGRQVEPARD